MSIIASMYTVSVIISLIFVWWYCGTDLKNLGGYKGSYDTLSGMATIGLWLLMIVPVMNLVMLAMMSHNYYQTSRRFISHHLDRSSEAELEFANYDTEIRIMAANRFWSIPIKKINKDPMLLQEYTTHAKLYLADWNGQIRKFKQSKTYAEQLINEARREARENRPQEGRGGRLL